MAASEQVATVATVVMVMAVAVEMSVVAAALERATAVVSVVDGQT